MERLRLGNGKWETAKYNERLQVTQIGLGNSATDTSLLKLEFGYGNNTQNDGSMRSQKISFNGLAQPFEQTYAYDDLNRLQSATETINNGATTTWKQTFQYDRFGNRRIDAANTTTIGTSNKVTNPQINTSDNRLKKDQDNDTITDYDYDKTGNMTLDAENKRFIYDAENHVKSFFKGTNGSATPDATYFYDGEGNRVKKISSTETTIFVYDGDSQLVAEYSTVSSSQPKVSYLTADHLGSPRIITDATGKVISRHDYLAFGDEVTDTVGNVGGRSSTNGYSTEDYIRKQYTGYEKDEESGLDFAQARYYNGKHGRFTSVDPLTASANVKDPQTFNRYSYAMNSPYKFTDPLGLLSVSTGACGICQGDGGGSFSAKERDREVETEQTADPPQIALPADFIEKEINSRFGGSVSVGGEIYPANIPGAIITAIFDAATSIYNAAYSNGASSQAFANNTGGQLPQTVIDANSSSNTTTKKATTLDVGLDGKVSKSDASAKVTTPLTDEKGQTNSSEQRVTSNLPATTQNNIAIDTEIGTKAGEIANGVGATEQITYYKDGKALNSTYNPSSLKQGITAVLTAARERGLTDGRDSVPSKTEVKIPK
jgi:RHS repeat-associated protein